MADSLIAQYKLAHPEYADIPDLKLAVALRNSRPEYKALPPQDFYRKVGVASAMGIGEEAPEMFDPGKANTTAENAFAAAGSTFVDTGNRLMQYAAKGGPLGAPVLGLMDSFGIKRPKMPGEAQADARIAAKDELDAPLMAAPGSTRGKILGNLMQLAGPGVVAKTAAATPRLGVGVTQAAGAAGKALMPQGYRGNSALGGIASTLMNPLREGESEAFNTGLGVAGGFGGRALGGGIAGTVKGVGSLLQPFTEGGQNTILANTINRFKTGGLLNYQPDSIPGVTRTLAEGTADPGIAGLQRSMANLDVRSDFANARQANQVARSRAIEGIAGDDAAMAAAEAARDVQALPKLGMALTKQGVDTLPVQAEIDAILKSGKGQRSVIQSVLAPLKAKIEKAGDSVEQLYGIRQEIDDLMTGRVGGDSSGATLARKELMAVKAALDDQIKKQAPEFGDYLSDYIAGSRPINQMEIGRALLGTGNKSISPVDGEYTAFTPDAFGKQVGNLDALAVRATGFPRANAGLLDQGQRDTLEGVRSGLLAQKAADTGGRAVGSNTAQNLVSGNFLDQSLGPLLGRISPEIPVISKVTSGLDKLYNTFGIRDELQAGLKEVLINPTGPKAAAVLAKLSKSDRSKFDAAMEAAGVSAGLEGSRQPLDIGLVTKSRKEAMADY